MRPSSLHSEPCPQCGNEARRFKARFYHIEFSLDSRPVCYFLAHLSDFRRDD